MIDKSYIFIEFIKGNHNLCCRLVLWDFSDSITILLHIFLNMTYIFIDIVSVLLLQEFKTCTGQAAFCNIGFAHQQSVYIWTKKERGKKKKM